MFASLQVNLLQYSYELEYSCIIYCKFVTVLFVAHLHNQFLLAILTKCQSLGSSVCKYFYSVYCFEALLYVSEAINYENVRCQSIFPLAFIISILEVLFLFLSYQWIYGQILIKSYGWIVRING